MFPVIKQDENLEEDLDENYEYIFFKFNKLKKKKNI